MSKTLIFFLDITSYLLKQAFAYRFQYDWERLHYLTAKIICISQNAKVFQLNLLSLCCISYCSRKHISSNLIFYARK